MTPHQLRQIGEAMYGYEWKAHIAARLNVNIRTVQRWANGQNEIPDWVESELREKETER